MRQPASGLDAADRGEPCRPKRNGRRRLTLPRPRLVNVIELVESIERAGPKERRKALPRLDEDLAKAVSEDMAKYVGGVMSSVSFRSNAPGANGVRTKQVFTRFGWCNVQHPYRIGSPEGSDVFKAFGVVQKTTPSASQVATTLAVTQGAFREAAGSAVDRTNRRLHSREPEASAEAKDALNHLDKRRDNMRYGWPGKHGYYISSCHMEAAARILVARRCKQAGMHGRHHNAACVCAIIARLRSAA